jgi:hypothetical protein
MAMSAAGAGPPRLAWGLLKSVVRQQRKIAALPQAGR